jgi:hypothetical protein
MVSDPSSAVDAEGVPDNGRGKSLVVRISLAVILVVGAVLRFVGLRFGFPFRTHPDEWAIVDAAMEMAQRHSFEPATFYRPDHFEIKLNFLIDSAYSQLRYGLPLELAWDKHELAFVLIGRGISAVFGVGCVLLAFLIVRRINPIAGLYAAALVAVFTPLVTNAHYATPESPQAFFMLLMMFFCMLYLEKPRLWPILASAASIGVAFSIKYPAVLTAVVIAAAISVVAWKQRSWRVFFGHAAASVAALIAGIFVISPVLVLEPVRVLDEIRRQGDPVHPGGDGLGWLGNLSFYVSDFFSAAGILLVIASLGGAVWAVWHRRVETLPLWAGVPYWLGLSVVALHWTRWGVPMYVTPLLFAGIGIQVFLSWVWGLRMGEVRRGAVVAVRSAAVVVVAILGLNQIASAVAAVSSLAATDTRVAGLVVNKRLGIKVKNTVAEGYSPLIPDAPKPVFRFFTIKDGQLRLVSKNTRITYLILSSGLKERFLAEAKYVDEQRFYAAVEEQTIFLEKLTPVAVGGSVWELWNIPAEFSTASEYWRGGFTGPVIYYYDISALPRG